MNEVFEVMKPYIRGKDVLDIGCCGWYSRHIEENISDELEGWLHGHIKRYARSVMGIDISKKCIDYLRGRGYDIKLANAEGFDLNRKFDVIVAGELIEHLSNFQGFFDSINKHLEENGLLILTTPNVFYLRQILFLILRGYPAVNPEHVCWFDEITIRQLLNKFGFCKITVLYGQENRVCTMYKNRGAGALTLKEIPFRLIEKLVPLKKVKYGTMIIIAEKEG